MPRGQGQSAVLTSGQLGQVSRSRPKNIVNPASPSRVALSQRGNVRLVGSNKFEITGEDFEALYLVEKAGKDLEKEFVSARDIIDTEKVFAEGPALSHCLRKLAAEGHLEMKKGDPLTFKNTRNLDEYYPWRDVDIPAARAGKRYGRQVHLSVHNGYGEDAPEKIMFTQDGGDYQKVEILISEGFARGARNIAERVLKGKEKGVQIIDANDKREGSQRFLTLFPYQFKKGLKKKTLIGFKFITLFEGSSTDVHWNGADYEPTFMDGLVEPNDLLDAATLIENRRDAERGRLNK